MSAETNGVIQHGWVSRAARKGLQGRKELVIGHRRWLAGFLLQHYGPLCTDLVQPVIQAGIFVALFVALDVALCSLLLLGRDSQAVGPS